MRKRTTLLQWDHNLILSSGCEPLTPDDIAEVVVFNAARRENVVVADTLIFPNHQVQFFAPFSFRAVLAITASFADRLSRPRPQLCIRSRDVRKWANLSYFHRLVPAVRCTRGRHRSRNVYS